MQPLPELADGVRALGEHCPSGGHHVVDIHSGEGTREWAVPPLAFDDGLQRRAQHERVPRRDQVDRRPQQRGGPHCAALGDQRGQLVGPKALDPRPEAQVGVRRHLCLHADQAFDDVESGKLLPLKEELSREEGTVQRPPGEDRRHASGCQTA